MTTPTPAPTPAPTAAAKAERKAREVPVQRVTVSLPAPVDGEVPSLMQWRFIVEGTEAQAREWLERRFVEVRRATPQDLIEAGRDNIPFEKAAGGEGGAA